MPQLDCWMPDEWGTHGAKEHLLFTCKDELLLAAILVNLFTTMARIIQHKHISARRAPNEIVDRAQDVFRGGPQVRVSILLLVRHEGNVQVTIAVHILQGLLYVLCIVYGALQFILARGIINTNY